MRTQVDVGIELAGRYRVERELGSEGVATVYLGEGVRHRRKLTALGELRRRSDQFDFDIARGRMYFTLRDVESPCERSTSRDDRRCG